MWVRKRLDIGWSDFCYGGLRCFWPSKARQETIEKLWAGNGHALVCLSVRTGFDLLLRALDFPKGSEVLMSALNVPGMMRVAEENGLKPVPLDIDGDGLRPSIAGMRRAITPRTRLLVVAHLFGARLDLGDINTLARERGLLTVEDCAQAFDGVPFAMPPGCDVAMHSFGPVKTATALGGAVLTVRDGALADRMRAIERRYATQSRLRYGLRLLKYAGLKALSYRLPFSALAGGLALAGCDYDVWLKEQVRGFDDAQFLAQLRQRPCMPLMALLAWRLRRFDAGRMAGQQKRGRRLAERLGEAFPPVGKDAAAHIFNLFPVRARDPMRVMAMLRRHGFDASMRGSMAAVSAPANRPEWEPALARRLLDGTVFLPLYPEMPNAEVERMADTLLEV